MGLGCRRRGDRLLLRRCRLGALIVTGAGAAGGHLYDRGHRAKQLCLCTLRIFGAVVPLNPAPRGDRRTVAFNRALRQPGQQKSPVREEPRETHADPVCSGDGLLGDHHQRRDVAGTGAPAGDDGTATHRHPIGAGPQPRSWNPPPPEPAAVYARATAAQRGRGSRAEPRSDPRWGGFQCCQDIAEPHGTAGRDGSQCCQDIADPQDTAVSGRAAAAPRTRPTRYRASSRRRGRSGGSLTASGSGCRPPMRG